MTHNHKPVVHMRTMSMMVLILLRPAFEILNQCLKAFTLFMHNLTPTTAIDVHRIFGEDESGRVEVLNPRPFCEMMKERRRRLIKWPSLTVDKTCQEEIQAILHAGGFFFNQLNLRNIMLDVRNQLVFFLMRCPGFYRQIKTDHPTSAEKHRQRQKDRCGQADAWT